MLKTTVQTQGGRRDVTLNPEQVCCVFRPPLQQDFAVVTTLVPLQASGNYDDVLSAIKERGFVEFDSPDGGKAYVNPKQVIMFGMVELGVVLLSFPGGGQLPIRDTIADVERKLGGSQIVSS